MEKRPLLKEVLANLGDVPVPADRDMVSVVLKYHPVFDRNGLDNAVALWHIGGWGIFGDMQHTAEWFQIQEGKIDREQNDVDRFVVDKQAYARRYGGGS